MSDEDDRKKRDEAAAVDAALAVVGSSKDDGEQSATEEDVADVNSDAAATKKWPSAIKEALETGHASYEPSDDPAHYKPAPKGKL